MRIFKQNLPSIIILFLFLGLLFTTPQILLFYDAPEYMLIVRDNDLLKSITMGHLPIHPIFIAFLWMGTRLVMLISNVSSWQYAANITSVFFGIFSILAFYKLTHIHFKNQSVKLLSLLLFSFFPLVWVINSNLMVESLMLPFFIISIYSLQKMQGKKTMSWVVIYTASIFVLVGSHVQTLFWLPAILGFHFLTFGTEKFDVKSFKSLLMYTTVGVLFGLGLYSAIYIYTGRDLVTSLRDLLFAHHGTLDYQDPVGYLRMFRNIYLTIARGFGALSVFLIVYFIFKDRKKRYKLIGWVLVLMSIFIEGAIWSGDYMQRRQVYLGVILAILVVKRLRMRSVLFLIYLMLLLLPNILLYSDPVKNMPLYQLKHISLLLPENEVYLQSHYLSPFINSYKGEIIWVDSVSVKQVEDVLKEKRVFIDSQGIKAPYYLYSGNNYHITSLGRVGVSAAQPLFKNFNFCYYTNYGEIIVYEIKHPEDECNNDQIFISGRSPGEPVVFYSSNPLKRVQMRRVDYGDIFTWLWYLGVDKRDALDWVYADVDGDVVYVNPRAIAEELITGELLDLQY